MLETRTAFGVVARSRFEWVTKKQFALGLNDFPEGKDLLGPLLGLEAILVLEVLKVLIQDFVLFHQFLIFFEQLVGIFVKFEVVLSVD